MEWSSNTMLPRAVDREKESRFLPHSEKLWRRSSDKEFERRHHLIMMTIGVNDQSERGPEKEEHHPYAELKLSAVHSCTLPKRGFRTVQGRLANLDYLTRGCVFYRRV